MFRIQQEEHGIGCAHTQWYRYSSGRPGCDCGAKWVLTWGGVVFPQTPLDTREQATNRLTRMQKRYPGECFTPALKAGERVPKKIGYRWTMPDGQTGVVVCNSKADAVSVLRHNLKRKALPKGTTWEVEREQS